MENGLKVLLVIFMSVVIGAALLSSVADNTTSATQLNTVNNRTVALTNGTTFSLGVNQLNSFTSIYNATNASQPVAAANYTIDLQQGTLLLTNGISGNYNVSYTSYLVGDSTSRTLLNTNTLFFALGILLLVIAAAYPMYMKMFG